jgi:hypothetical protein
MDSLNQLVEATIRQPVDPAFLAMAAHIQKTHGGKVRAVLAYGSALRGTAPGDTLLDLYLLTDSFEDVSTNPISRLACRLVPPNVYYAETTFQGETLRAKYAALPLTQFADWMTENTGNPYFWARFCQPVRLLHATNATSESAVVEALATALRTMHANALALAPHASPADVFAAGFAATYSTELRPESSARSRSIVENNAAYYEDAARLMAGTAPRSANWAWRRLSGKLLSVVRLTKAAFTFSGGVDYAAWKIARHSGQTIEITDWNRRHPLLTGLLLLPRLLRKGALR